MLIYKSVPVTFLCEKSGAMHTPSATQQVTEASRLAGSQLNPKFCADQNFHRINSFLVVFGLTETCMWDAI